MPNPNFGNIQYKASNGLIKLDELEGIVECFVSGIGNKDSVGDICATGAFAKSLQRRKPRVVWGHNWNDPIGKVLEIYEVPASDPRLPMKMKMAGIGGLYAKVQFNLQSEKGKEAFANVAFFGEEQEWSIGYKTLRAQYDDNLQANVLYEVELYEVSPVLHGANQLTGTISVKSDEEKMHGMMPLVIGAPSAPAPRRDGIFDEGMSQTISGPQLAGVVAELSRRAGGPVMVVNATENSVVFVKPGKGKFRIGYHFTGSEYMFGKPELIHAEQAKPPVQSGPSPMPGIVGKPNKPSTNNPAMPMPVAMKPGNGGMVMVPLPRVEYDGMDKDKKPELVAEERELAESLVRIAGKYGKFDEDGSGIWAGYYPPEKNKVKDIGVKCSNCVLYLGGDKCKILDIKVEAEGKCRFAIIPDGVVVGYGKKEYNEILDEEEIKMVEDIEAKYPGEFILGVLRNTIKKRRRKRRRYKTLEEWGVEEQELMEKGLDPFLAQDSSYVIPVDPTDAFEFKSMIDPVLEYHRIDTFVNEYGVVIASQLDQEAKDALETASLSAYEFLKKKIAFKEIEEKALGRRIGRAIGSRAIDRPNIGGKKRRSGRGMGVPSGDLDPRTRRDSNLDGTLFDNIPGWEQPDPTPDGPGSINNPKPSKRQLTNAAKPDGKEKLSSGARNLRRHADRSADMEKQFPNAEENQKRSDHEAIAKAWDEQGLGWEEVPRYNADDNLSSDYLRGREIGVNQARVMWDGDSVRKRPEKFNEKQKASNEYSNWYSSYAKSVSAYLDAHSRDDSDNWDGIESALRADVKSKYPDTQDWAKEDIATLNEYLNDIGLLDIDKLKKKKKKKAGTEAEKGPDLQELRRLNSEGKLSSGGKKKPAPKKDKEKLSSGRGDRTRDPVNDGFLRETDYNDPDSGYGLVPKLMENIGFDENEARDAMDNWNSLDDDEKKGFEDARNGDSYGAISDAWDESQASTSGEGKLSSGKSPEYLKGREEGSKQIRAMWRGDSTNERPYKFDEKNNASIAYRDWYWNTIRRAGAFLEASRDDNSELYNGMEDAIHEFMNINRPDQTGFRGIGPDGEDSLIDHMRQYGFDPYSPVPLRKQKDKDKRSSSRLSSGKAKKYTADDIGDEEFNGAMDIYGKKEIYDGVYGKPSNDELEDAYGGDQGGRDGRETSYFMSSDEMEDAFYDDTEITDDDIASFLNDLPENERAWFAEESSLPNGPLSGTRDEQKARREKYDLPFNVSSGDNPSAMEEIRRIVETNESIENAAIYVGLDDYQTGPTSRAMGARILDDGNKGRLPVDGGEQLDLASELIDEFFPDANSAQKRGMQGTVFNAIERNSRESRNRSGLSSGRREALDEAMSRESSPSRAFEGYGGDIDFEVGTGGYDDSGPFMDEYLVDLDTVSNANGRDFIGNTVTFNDGRRGVIIDGTDFDIEMVESEYSSRKDTPRPRAGTVSIVVTHDENGNQLDTPEVLDDEIAFDTDNGTGFLIADEDMWSKQNDKENEGFTLIQIDDNQVDDAAFDDLYDEVQRITQPAKDEARAKQILSSLDYRGNGEEYKARLRRELGQIRQRQFARGEQEKLSSGRRGKPGSFAGRRGELAMAGSYGDPEEESRKDQIWELNQIGHSDAEAEQILEHWNNVDSDKRDEYLEEFGAGGTRFSEDVAYAASELWQNYSEAQYDNRQSRNLSSGRKKNQEELNISDREIFERRMSGESLMDTASALGMTREDVRQAEIRHMARERGTLNRPDFDEIESYREDQARLAAEEAEELSMNESIYNRRMGGESLADTAKALGMTREQVRRKEQKHMQLLRDRDREAKYWIEKQDGDTLGSGRKKYVSPLEDMNPGQRLSSGKLDEVYRSVQEQLIEQIQKAETEGGKWEFPWHRDASLPRNAMNNNRPYSGINSLMLMFKKDAMGYETGLWAGFNQWKEKGGTVRKGEKGTLIIIPTVIPAKKDADGNEVKAGSIFFKTGYVFNLDQIEGIDKEQFKMPQLSEEERVAELEQALSEVGAVVNHGGDRAFYRPSTDEITLPPFASFKSKEAYYAVFAHELMHWTGHPSRLGRDHLGEFGSPEYAQEELVAEIASAFFMTAHGLTPEPREDHAQYLASWLKKLKSDPDALKNAFEQAQKAHDFAIALSPSMSKKLGRKVAEAGVIPGNRDATYDGGPASLSSGRRNKYVLNPEGTTRTLADEMGAFGDEVLTEFSMRKGYRDGDRNWFEAQAFLGGRSRPSKWNVSQDESGEWFAELMVMDGVDDNDEIDWDIAGVGSEGFKSPEDAARWADSYASSRREWQRKFKAETDIEKIAEMLKEEEARRDAEYENYKRASRERADRQEYVRMMAQIDESRLEWSAEDWADEANDIQAELARENSRLSSGVRSRYDETPAEEIGLVTDALKRTDEAGSNSRHIAANLPAVPVEKYDFDSIRRNGEVISFTYNGKPRMVYPTGMMTKKGGGIYFIGLDEESGQYRSFSLHKIEGLVDGAVAPINPTQPGVPQGTSFSSGRRTRSLVSSRIPGGGRLSSGRSPEDIRSEFEKSGQFNNPVTQDALDGKIGFLPNGGRGRIALEDHKKAIDAIDDLVATRDEYIRAALDGKKITKQNTPSIDDLTGQISDDDMEFIDRLDSAIYDIESQLEDHVENLALLNEQTDDLREKIGLLENSYRNSWRDGGKVDFESAMQKHIDDADGDAADAVDSMRFDAQEIQGVLEDIEAIDDSFIRSSLQSQINEIEDLVDSINNTTKPEDFAAKLSDMYYGAINRLERELSDLFGIGESFEESGVSLNRESKGGLPEDIFSSSNLSNFDMVEGDAADFLEPGDVPGLSSGRRSRTQGSKRRPMSDADRQAFADGVRQRAATIPGKRRPGPSREEFGTDRLSSGRMRFPDSAKRRKIGERISEYTSVKVGKLSENNDRSPDGKWMLDASKLNLILKDENGKPLNVTEIAAILGIDKAEAEKFNAPGAAISEADASTLIDQMFFNGSNPAATDELVEAIWGFDSKPYWYDMRRGNQLSRGEYEDYVEEGILRKGLLAPEGMEETEEFVASEMSRRGFALSDLADALGTQSTSDLMEALTFEADGEKIVPTAVQMKKWKRSGIPTGIVEQLIENGIIPNAGDVFGEEGAVFDNSIKQFDLWKNVSDAISRTGKKFTGAELDEIIGATKVQTRLKAFEEGKEGKYSARVGKALRYSDDEVKEIVDRMNKKYGLDETVASIKDGPSMSSGRRAARRISNTGAEAAERLSSGRVNNGAPENITPRMQNEIMGWAENATWSNFAQSLVSQFKAQGFLSATQWTSLLRLHDNSKRRR
jgi:HK97 family phage prohead protease